MSVVRLRPRSEVAVVAMITALVGAGVAFAMTVTGYHYLTDAVGGFCLAVAVVLGLAGAIERLPPRIGSVDAVRVGDG